LNASPTPVETEPQSLAAVWMPSDARAIWQALADDAGLALLVVDSECRFLYVNRHFEALTDQKSGDVVGKKISESVSSDVGRERETLVLRAMASGKPIMLHEVFLGAFMRTMIRPLCHTDETFSSALIVHHYGSQADPLLARPPEHEVVIPKFHVLGKIEALSRREREVLQLIGEGMTTAAIAKKLFRTTKTVEHHRASLGRKLGLKTRVEIANVAHRFRGINLAEIK